MTRVKLQEFLTRHQALAPERIMGVEMRHDTVGGDGTGAAADGTMRAIVQDRYGSADVLRLARIAPPKAADNEVLVRVRAAGLDRGTWHLMTGRPRLLRLVLPGS